jgi:hypothetical protein
MKRIKTPLEQNGFQRYSSSEEIVHYLQTLASAAGQFARLDCIGHSAQGREILVLYCGDDSNNQRANRQKLRVMLAGSQHGASEAAGCEALLHLARAILTGELQQLLEHFGFIMIPNANPDGRERDSSKNGNDVNINRDFVLLSQPESRALDAAVLHYRPAVVLDLHESAMLKRKTLGLEGYLTDFEAQFDVASHPAISQDLQNYAESQLLPTLIAAVETRGLRAQRYIREITSTKQPVTHGDLTMRTFRNKAGLRGALAILLETPMEPKADPHPTFRNIAVRTEKQWCCLQALLQVLQSQQPAILAAVTHAAQLPPQGSIALNGSYVPRNESPVTRINLRRRDTREIESIEFADHRAIAARDFLRLPNAYIVQAHTGIFADLFERHRIPYNKVTEPFEALLESHVFAHGDTPEHTLRVLDTSRDRAVVIPGSLYVPLLSDTARLLPLLLDPRSSSSVFQYPQFTQLIAAHQPFFIARVPDQDR